MTELVVCNAGPLIHLDQLRSLDLLSDFLTLPTLFIKSTLLTDIKRTLREEWRLGE